MRGYARRFHSRLRQCRDAPEPGNSYQYVHPSLLLCTWNKYTVITPSGMTVHITCLHARPYKQSGYSQRSWITTMDVVAMATYKRNQ